MRLAPPWKRCVNPACGYVHAASICHMCKTPAPVLVTEADIELEAAVAVAATEGGSSGNSRFKHSSLHAPAA